MRHSGALNMLDDVTMIYVWSEVACVKRGVFFKNVYNSEIHRALDNHVSSLENKWINEVISLLFFFQGVVDRHTRSNSTERFGRNQIV